MEKIVNDIYNICEDKFKSYQVERLISELESLVEIKIEQEDEEERKNNPYYYEDKNPYDQVAKDNCEAFSENTF